jgi:hypothetical protein
MAKPRNDGPAPTRGPTLEAITAAWEAAKTDEKRRLAVTRGEHSVARMLGEMVDEARARVREALCRVIVARGGG